MTIIELLNTLNGELEDARDMFDDGEPRIGHEHLIRAHVIVESLRYVFEHINFMPGISEALDYKFKQINKE